MLLALVYSILISGDVWSNNSLSIDRVKLTMLSTGTVMGTNEAYSVERIVVLSSIEGTIGALGWIGICFRNGAVGVEYIPLL